MIGVDVRAEAMRAAVAHLRQKYGISNEMIVNGLKGWIVIPEEIHAALCPQEQTAHDLAAISTRIDRIASNASVDYMNLANKFQALSAELNELRTEVRGRQIYARGVADLKPFEKEHGKTC